MKAPARHFFASALAASLLSGCAVVDVDIRETPARDNLLAQGGEAAAELGRAIRPAMTRDQKTAALINAARIARSARSQSGQPRAAAIERQATGELVRVLAEDHFASAGAAGLRLRGASKQTIDPRAADRIIPADAITIGGLRSRTTQDGAGAPCVAWFAQNSPALRGQPGVPANGLAEPVTAVLEFGGAKPELVFYRTMKTDRAMVGGRTEQLAADFSAPVAYAISRGHNKALDIRAMMRPDLNMKKCALTQIEPYDPDKIPVVFVHGLMSRPETWTPATNDLLGDRRIRERYQFWYYLYPTGLPVWASTAKLRMELDRFRNELDPDHSNRNLDRMVLVGHSMGGLISSLLIRQGGKPLWKQFTDMSPEQLNISPEAKAQLNRLTNFAPRKDIARVVFVSTPHCGSRLALLPLARFFSSLVRLPVAPLMKERRAVLANVREDVRAALVAPANSIRFLRAKSPMLAAILKLPMREGVPYHSIIGDRGRGNSPNSSDGVVPYWSSHLDGAVSEKVVPSGHGANENPEGVAEMRRILTTY